MSFLQRIIINLLTLVTMSVLLPSMIHLDGLTSALFSSIVLALLNMIIKPVLSILALPITVLTFGLFSFVINAAMLELTTVFVSGFYLSSFWTALLAALILSFVNSVVTRNMLEY